MAIGPVDTFGPMRVPIVTTSFITSTTMMSDSTSTMPLTTASASTQAAPVSSSTSSSRPCNTVGAARSSNPRFNISCPNQGTQTCDLACQIIIPIAVASIFLILGLIFFYNRRRKTPTTTTIPPPETVKQGSNGAAYFPWTKTVRGWFVRGAPKGGELDHRRSLSKNPRKSGYIDLEGDTMSISSRRSALDGGRPISAVGTNGDAERGLSGATATGDETHTSEEKARSMETRI